MEMENDLIHHLWFTNSFINHCLWCPCKKEDERDKDITQKHGYCIKNISTPVLTNILILLHINSINYYQDNVYGEIFFTVNIDVYNRLVKEFNL